MHVEVASPAALISQLDLHAWVISAHVCVLVLLARIFNMWARFTKNTGPTHFYTKHAISMAACQQVKYVPFACRTVSRYTDTQDSARIKELRRDKANRVQR